MTHPGVAHAGRQPAVLLVDDQRANLDALVAALEPLGARLTTAGSAEDALRHLLTEEFAVVLLDVEMPGIDGFEAARLIRARERTRATPIIFVTARDRDHRTTAGGYSSGAVDVLFKPLDPDILRAKVAVFLELFRLRDESVIMAQLREANARLRHAVAEAEDARERAEESRAAKEQFLATMSHEIRTPINAILGYAQLIEIGLAGPITPEQRGYLGRLAASGQHLLGLVNDILDLSRIDAHEMRVAREPEWTGPVVAAALELAAPLADARQIELVDRRAGEPGVPYIGDSPRVRQILINLLSNAIKFTEPGGRVTVDCGVAEVGPSDTHLQGGGPWAHVEVSDTGIGIAPEHQDEIFDPFHQVEGGRTRTRGGSGLGLAISRRFARLMGGDITLASTPGAGSAFTLWLPAARESETPDARTARAVPGSLVVQVRGLCEIGEALRDEVHAVVRSFAARLRSDPATPVAALLRQPDLEDHLVTFLADVAEALIIVDESAAQATGLLEDATAIQRTIAERHGLRRQRQGWTEGAVRHEFQVLYEEIERAVRARIQASTSDLDQALGVVRRLTERAEDTSCRTWREAARREALE